MMGPLGLDDLTEPTPPTHDLRLKRDALDQPSPRDLRLTCQSLLSAALVEERRGRAEPTCFVALEHRRGT